MRMSDLRPDAATRSASPSANFVEPSSSEARVSRRRSRDLAWLASGRDAAAFFGGGRFPGLPPMYDAADWKKLGRFAALRSASSAFSSSLGLSRTTTLPSRNAGEMASPGVGVYNASPSTSRSVFAMIDWPDALQ